MNAAHSASGLDEGSIFRRLEQYQSRILSRALSCLGPRVAAVEPELVEWLQDYNWPVAHILAPFLAEIGLPLVPQIDHVFSTIDAIWQYWMIVCLLSHNDDLYEHYTQKLIQLAENPTDNDRHHELDGVARELLEDRGFYQTG